MKAILRDNLRLGIVLIAWICFSFQVAEGAEDCSNSLFPIQEPSGKFGYIDGTGKVIVPAKYDFASPFVGGMGTLRIDDDSDAIVDVSGKLKVLNGAYLISDFYNGIAVVRIKEGYALVDLSGDLKRIIQAKPEECCRPAFTSFNDGLVALNTSGGLSFVDTSANIRFSIDSAFLSSGFKQGMAAITYTNGTRSIVKGDGKFLVPPTLPNDMMISDPSDGLVRLGKHEAKLGEKIRWKYIDATGETVLTVAAEYAGDFNEGFAEIMADGKWGYISRTGDVVIQPRFDSTEKFYSGVAVVEVNKKFGFIDSRGEILLSPRFDNVYEPFNCGLALVRQGDVNGYINKKGEWVWRNAAQD
jgi:hypothetical protein